MLKKYYSFIVAFSLFLILWVYIQGVTRKTLFRELIPVKIPREFYRINEWLNGQRENFKVIYLPPQFEARFLSWAQDRPIGNFLTQSSAKPTLTPAAPYSKLYYLFWETTIGNVARLDKFFDIMNSKYIILRDDLSEEYYSDLKKSLENNPGLKKTDLTEIDPELFCHNAAYQDTGDDLRECATEKKIYSRIFENQEFAPQIWAPEKISLVVGGMEALDILNSQENFNPVNQGLIFVNQEPGALEKIKNLKFENIIFNNASEDDLIFSFIQDQYLINPAPLTQEGGNEWRKASTEEPLHGEWHRVIDSLKIPNWDFDFGKSLIYSETVGEKINVPLRVDQDGEYLFILRYFQNNKGGRLKIILRQRKKIVETLNLNNKFTTEKNLLLLEKGDYFLNIENLGGFNAVNLIALVPAKEYQQYQTKAQTILEENRVLYLQKISPEMIIEPLELNLPRENNYAVSLRLKNDQNKIEENQEEDDQSNEKKGIIEMEKLDKESAENINLFNFGNLKYNLLPGLYQKIFWQNLGKIFLKQKEKIPIYRRIKPTSILTMDNFSILDQGNLEISGGNGENLENPVALKVSNLIPKIEVIQGSQTSERRGRLITDAIKVKEGENFYLEYEFQGENLKGVDARILFYGEDYDLIYQRTAFKAENFMNDQKGNVGQKKISHFFGTPESTHYIKIEFKAEPNLEEESWFKISDFKLFEEESLSGIDALMLSEDKKEAEGTKIQPIISYEKINPTQYKISFSKADSPFILAFAESFDPMWKLKEASKEGYFQKRFNSLFSKNNDAFPHFPIYSVINGFYVNPQKIKTNELILEYEPQNWFEAGLWISASTLAISLFTFIIYITYKKSIKKYA